MKANLYFQPLKISIIMSHSIVNVSLQSMNQSNLCEQVLETMTRDDMDSLLIVTSTYRVSVS